MPKTERIDPDNLEVGQIVTAWFLPSGFSGQGGRIISVDPDSVSLMSGTAQYLNEVTWDSVHHWTIELPYEASECLEYSDACVGQVDDWWSGGSRSWPRCSFHGERRIERYENSLERYAYSDVAPPGYYDSDEFYAHGQHWGDDY
jgi:hypothetical protein